MQSDTTSDEEDDEDPTEAPAPSMLLNPPPAALKRKEPPSGEQAQNHKKAVKSSQPVSLPPPLDTALLEHVELEVSNNPTTGVAKTDMSNPPIVKAMSVIEADLTKIKLVLIRMLCSRWSIKKYRQAFESQVP